LLIILEVSVLDHLAPLLGAYDEAKHYGGEHM
jgi:hypothetical protein